MEPFQPLVAACEVAASRRAGQPRDSVYATAPTVLDFSLTSGTGAHPKPSSYAGAATFWQLADKPWAVRQSPVECATRD
jgi:hypothetical protein